MTLLEPRLAIKVEKSLNILHVYEVVPLVVIELPPPHGKMDDNRHKLHCK